jgi:hypothetical protein
VSPAAESSLAFANIYPEWLADDKAARVNHPEEPFFHSEVLFFDILYYLFAGFSFIFFHFLNLFQEVREFQIKFSIFKAVIRYK